MFIPKILYNKTLMANYIYVVLVMCVENVVVFPIIGVIFHLNQHAGIYSKIHTNHRADLL